MLPRYLRISVTARCNLHCFYCRDADECASAADEPGVGEIELLGRSAAAEGVRKVRITGGEPLVREDLEEIVEAVSGVSGITETTLTTNAIGLAERASRLKQAGLDRVNISLDTLKARRFRTIAGASGHRHVLAAIETCAAIFETVKLNTVLLPGVNEDEIETLVEFALERGLWIRFIERYSHGKGEVSPPVSMKSVKRRLERSWGTLEPLQSRSLSVEDTYRLPGESASRVGLIASVSHPPCETCTRLRFTASGVLLPCLFARDGIDVTGPLQEGDGAAVRRAIRRAFALKRRCLASSSPGVSSPVSYIGG